ncbi:MAG TPA: hypothetical protein VKQ30_10175 [Ktedonobacterales bacterium]|nr:hypothetical protein [Ktedonobacterales bacterium]
MTLLVLCVALFVATATEARVCHGIEQQVDAAQARYTALQRDVAATWHSISVAKTARAIEREGRA